MSLSLTRVSKNSKEKALIRDISLSVARGEVFGIFGTDNSGKETIIDLIAGKIRPDSGMISIDGAVLTERTAAERLMAETSDANNPFWKNLFLRRRRSYERTLNDFLARDTGESLPVVIDDNVLNALLTPRDVTIDKLRDAAKLRRIPVILATANFTNVLLACDRAAVLADGKIVQEGTPQEIYELPCSEIVASTVGRMNFFVARRLTSSKSDSPVYQTIVGEHRLSAQRIERANIPPINQNVLLAIRPEHISISFGASFPEDNLMRSKVTRIRFLGPLTRVEFETNGLAIEAAVPRIVGLEVGAECMLGLPPDRIRVYSNNA